MLSIDVYYDIEITIEGGSMCIRHIEEVALTLLHQWVFCVPICTLSTGVAVAVVVYGVASAKMSCTSSWVSVRFVIARAGWLL